MRTIRLGRIVAEAEVLRLRRMAIRLAIDIVLLLIAVVFLLAALALGHVALYLWLAPRQGALYSVLYILAGDVVLAVLFVGAVLINGPGRVERQALEVRQTARAQLAQSLTLPALLASVTRAIGARQAVSLARNVLELLAKRAKHAPAE
jgi:hypothetical protein